MSFAIDRLNFFRGTGPAPTAGRTGVSAPAAVRAGDDAVVLQLSPAAQRFLKDHPAADARPSGDAGGGREAAGGKKSGPPGRLSPSDEAKVKELKRQDQNVRAHEQQHMAAAGGHARSGPKFEFVTGPDGNQYAVGGHVEIDTSPVSGDPAATIAKAQAIQRAALAPAAPSPADRAVAAQAAQMEVRARTEEAQNRPAPDGAPASPAQRAYAATLNASGTRLLNACESGCGCGSGSR